MSLWESITNTKHVEYLEKTIEDMKASRLEELKTLREHHASELQYARGEIARLQDELERTRLLLDPGLRKEEVSTASPSDPVEALKELSTMGTPWQRILAREIKKQDEDANKRRVAPAPDMKVPENPAPQESTNAV